ncbi:MAG: hypothetical protein ABH879_03575 [archaeon]
MKPYPRKWETVSSGTYRLLVPGGWLVQVESTYSDAYDLAITFFPDPEHSWELTRKSG